MQQLSPSLFVLSLPQSNLASHYLFIDHQVCKQGKVIIIRKGSLSQLKLTNGKFICYNVIYTVNPLLLVAQLCATLFAQLDSWYVSIRVSNYKGEPDHAAAIYNNFMSYMLTVNAT